LEIRKISLRIFLGAAGAMTRSRRPARKVKAGRSPPRSGLALTLQAAMASRNEDAAQRKIFPGEPERSSLLSSFS
jgi:hypothetical protein